MPGPYARDLWGKISQAVLIYICVGTDSCLDLSPGPVLLRGDLFGWPRAPPGKKLPTGMRQSWPAGRQKKGERGRLRLPKKNLNPPGGELRIAPCFLGPQFQNFAAPAKISVPFSGRSSGFRINRRPAPSQSCCRSVASCRLRPRLQRRDRDGFAPSSLFVPKEPE